VFLLAILLGTSTLDSLPESITQVEPWKPIVRSSQSCIDCKNILLSVTTTDVAGLEPGRDGFKGAHVGGECRVYWNAVPVTSDSLRERSKEQADKHHGLLGGEEALKSGALSSAALPAAELRLDLNTPFRCLGGVLFNLQLAGYRRIKFLTPYPGNTDKIKIEMEISFNEDEINSAGCAVKSVYVDRDGSVSLANQAMTMPQFEEYFDDGYKNLERCEISLLVNPGTPYLKLKDIILIVNSKMSSFEFEDLKRYEIFGKGLPPSDM
jgi:biopolymer transport protein ExbD